jgi:hypothetical protein
MNALDAITALNQRATREKWFYHCDPGLSFSDGYYDPLLKRWRDILAKGKMPKRSEITARDLKDVLRNIVMFERVAPSKYRWRLIGTNLTSMAGDNTGKMFDETLPPDHVARWVACADVMLAEVRPLRFIGQVRLKGREYLEAENLFVPLANDSDEPSFVMGLCRYSPRSSQSDQHWQDQIAGLPGALL